MLQIHSGLTDAADNEPVETAAVINDSRFPRLHFINTDYGRMHSTGCELELDYISFFQVSH